MVQQVLQSMWSLSSNDNQCSPVIFFNSETLTMAVQRSGTLSLKIQYLYIAWRSVMRKGTRFLLVFGFTGSNLHNLWVSNLVTDIAQPHGYSSVSWIMVRKIFHHMHLYYYHFDIYGYCIKHN